jgi:hypothetical protein
MRIHGRAISLGALFVLIVACAQSRPAQVSARFDSRAVPLNPPCSAMLAERIPPPELFRERATGHLYDLYSVRSFPVSDLYTGKYVGVVERKRNGVSHGPSRALPGIGEGQSGCAKFWVSIPSGGSDPVAQGGIVLDRPGQAYLSQNALVCYHDGDNHPADARPEVMTIPDLCDRSPNARFVLSAAVHGGQPIEVAWTASGRGWRDDASTAIEEKYPGRSRESAVISVLKAMVEPGPWFPCEATACCRLFAS